MIERLFPKQKQPFFRDEWNNDILYTILNGHYVGALIYWLSVELLLFLEASFQLTFDVFKLDLLAGLSLAAQVPLGFLVKDFLSWAVHNALHRVPFLWRFHRLHHSAKVMDFWVVMRFHWMEIILYKTALFIPLLLVGISPEAFLFIIYIEVFWGFFNHANLNISLGVLKYIFNSPAMHLFHHEKREGDVGKNFGITLSLWDWLFGTVYWPKSSCGKLGFIGDESFPKSPLKQYLKP